MSSNHESHRPRWADHKTLRLCRQVLEALQIGIAGHCGDEVLQELFISSVEPAADPSRLQVTVDLPPDVSPADALARLEKAKGLLRSLAAEAISRKKVPDLVFRLGGLNGR
ncbi:MAG: ribosome-binding factor A [Planctomycetes bacterium]|nr:ribosome-binding factor A [Planctomycetota bacterium]